MILPIPIPVVGPCWYEPKYVCQSSADTYLLTEAVWEFSKNYENLRGYSWEYRQYGRGTDTDDNGKYETDCWYLVASTLEKLGYVGIGMYNIDPKYFCTVRYEDARPGDIIAFRGLDFDGVGTTRNPSHVAFLASSPQKNVNGSWTGILWEAANPTGGIRYGNWVVNDGFKYVLGIYRPKKIVLELKCLFPIVNDTPKPPPVDPLVLDLDGNGIQSLGLDAGIHFDHDRNGFKELSGWVGPGDGMLMLDKNGNGRLDDGNELFGGFTILPNGARASNGFNALAYYDFDGDGKIDAQDPIWSQLKMWQHVDYDSFAAAGCG